MSTMSSEEVVEYLAQRCFDVFDRDSGLADELQEAAIDLIRERLEEAANDWDKAVRAEWTGEISTEKFEECQQRFFDLIVDPFKRALMTQVLSEMIRQLANESLEYTAEVSGYV